MKTPLSIQILVKDNQETIENCLNSLKNLNARIIVGDLGCKDQTIRKCQKFDVEIMPLSLNDDLSQARNKIIQKCNSVWHMMIEPWEELISGLENITASMLYAPDSYKLHILQADMVSKETRLWHTSLPIKFQNPVYETIKAESKDLNVFISSLSGKRNLDLSDLIVKWQIKNPLSTEPLYYKACIDLIQKNYDSFLNYAEMFLHQQKNQDMSFFMTHYYASMVLCYIKKDYNKAIQMLMPCLFKKPAMAEFWCLLADTFYAINEYEKAECFYENAKILGSRRLKTCDYPMEISKYNEYPNKMIAACKKIKSHVNLYGSTINKSHPTH